MKKLLSFFLVLTAVFLCSCSGTTGNVSGNTYNFETDVQYYYRIGIPVPVTKSPDGYYVVGQHGEVTFVDKDSMKATVLCNKPNCSHEDMDICNAYIGEKGAGVGTQIQYYDGNLYSIKYKYNNDKEADEPLLVRYHLDGTGSKEITQPISDGFEQWFVHRGYFYYCTDSEILRIPLNSPKSSAEKLFTAKYYEEGVSGITALNAYGDYLYFYASISSEDSKEYTLNLNSLDYKILDGYSIEGFYNGELRLCKENENGVAHFTALLDGSNITEVETTQANTMIDYDPERKIVYHFDKTVGLFPSSYDLYDNNNQKLYSAKTPEGMQYTCPQDEKYFFAIKDGNLFCVDKMNSNSKMKKLCKLNYAKFNTPAYITVE